MHTVFSDVVLCGADGPDKPKTSLAVAIPVGIAVGACEVVVVIGYLIASKARGPVD